MEKLNSPQYKWQRPPWLVTTAPQPSAMAHINNLLKQGELSTVCDWANCPNIGECYSHGTATFLILGRICTRGCAFCPLQEGSPTPPDETEPINVAETVQRLGLKHVVITAVSRDDLPDGGAGHFAKTIKEIKRLCPDTSVEVLIPDFQGSLDALGIVAEANPDVLGHNLETVPRLYGKARRQAGYARSLDVLALVKQMNSKIWTKSGIMLGLGEKEEEILQVLRDLRRVKCDFLTLGQYLQPTGEHYEVVEYILPEEFDRYGTIARDLGFVRVLSCPLARSSYRAEEMLRGLKQPSVKT